MLIGAGIGIAVSGGFEIYKQINASGWNMEDWNWAQIARSAAGGALAGALSAIPIPGTGFLSYLGTFFLGGTASVVGGLVSGSVHSWQSGVFAFGLGGVASVAGRGLGDFVEYINVSKKVGAISAKAQSIASMSAKQKSLTIWNMVGMDNFTRNAFKGWGYEQIFDLLMLEATNQMAISSVMNLTRYSVYSALTSSLLSGWY